jgi:uncharacterized protein YkwD
VSIRSFAIALVAAAVILVTASAAASTVPSPTLCTHATATKLSPYAKEMLSLVNGARVAGGQVALTVNPVLECLARERSAVLASLNTITHDVPGYGLPQTMAEAAGYATSVIGENLAQTGTPVAEAAEEAFTLEHDPAHWANIMYPYYTQVGVTVYNAPSGAIVDLLFSGPIGGVLRENRHPSR